MWILFLEFGVDKGFDHHGSENQPCKTARNDGISYNAGYPTAVYYPGQKVVIAHPTKVYTNVIMVMMVETLRHELEAVIMKFY